jgi:hypothetical protein
VRRLAAGLVQSALAFIASINSLAFIGSLALARTWAAASMALSFFSFGAFFALGPLVVFVLFFLHMIVVPAKD